MWVSKRRIDDLETQIDSLTKRLNRIEFGVPTNTCTMVGPYREPGIWKVSWKSLVRYDFAYTYNTYLNNHEDFFSSKEDAEDAKAAIEFAFDLIKQKGANKVTVEKIK